MKDERPWFRSFKRVNLREYRKRTIVVTVGPTPGRRDNRCNMEGILWCGRRIFGIQYENNPGKGGLL